ncbi:DUF2852 domain-containing protein [Hyphomicrobium sp. 1Nfss2.1]|uniref:DUF2852 domain-containing protein n=1 Tax=Hyphomicrobium sp. 1Nfss2.1 TaxID=3413936 RepID=UPI003C7BBE4A
MPLILGFIGFIFAALVMFAWAAVWLVAALFWLAWPLVLLVFGVIAWRRQSRYWQQVQSSPASARTTSAQPFFKNSGNAAFDEYRADTLRRLDEEREKFRDFLEQRRKARDREAFDRYISERWGRPGDRPQGAIT